MRREKAACIQVLAPVILLGVLLALLRFPSHYIDCDTHQSCITCQTLDTPASKPSLPTLPQPEATKTVAPIEFVGSELAEIPPPSPQERAPPR